jgi:RNA polymerase sigma-70 factor (ECF subfamily)
MRARLIPLPRRGLDSADSGDEALVGACAQGDAAALATLFDRHQLAVFRFCSRLSGGDGEVDDLVQRTFLEAWRCASHFRRQSTVRTWLFGIAANLARHKARAEMRRGAFLASAREHPVPEVLRPDQHAERREQWARLARAIERLPHLLRVAFAMCDLEGVSGVEAARALGVPEGTIWRRLHDARKQLREALAGDAP